MLYTSGLIAETKSGSPLKSFASGISTSRLWDGENEPRNRARARDRARPLLDFDHEQEHEHDYEETLFRQPQKRFAPRPRAIRQRQ